MSMLKVIFAPINGPLLHSDTFSAPCGVYNPSCPLGASFFSSHYNYDLPGTHLYCWVDIHTFLNKVTCLR